MQMLGAAVLRAAPRGPLHKCQAGQRQAASGEGEKVMKRGPSPCPSLTGLGFPLRKTTSVLNPDTQFQGICGDRATPRSPGPSTTPRPRHQTVSPLLCEILASAVSLSPDHSGAALVLGGRGSSTEAMVTEHSGGWGRRGSNPPQTRATLHVSQGLPRGNRRLWSASAQGRCPPLTHRAGRTMEANKPLPPRSSKKQGQPTGARRPGPAARRLPR